MDFHAYIPYVNRPDLLKRADDSVTELWPNLTILDNSGYGVDCELPDSVEIYEPSVPLTFTQSQNFFFKDGERRGAHFILWLHNDVEVPEGMCRDLLHFARTTTIKWGVLYTHYDLFSAVNLAAAREVGGYDTMMSSYVSDIDFYHRMRLNGYETVDIYPNRPNPQVDALEKGHGGSRTIASDKRLCFLNAFSQAFAGNYYKAKWGGNGGAETFRIPFNRPDIFGEQTK